MSVKQVIVMRKDLNMRKGKMIAQGAHASMKVILNLMVSMGFFKILFLVFRKPVKTWLDGLFTKVVVGVDSERDLLDVYYTAYMWGIPCSIIEDAGKTEFNGVPTITCCAIGPDDSDKIDKITGDLTLL